MTACPHVAIEPLAEHHSREAFCCGHAEIDAYVRARLHDDHCYHKIRAVAGVRPGTAELIGFYSLVVGSVAAKAIPGKMKRLYGNRVIPVVYLAALGVHESDTRKGIGTALMLDAFEKAVKIANLAGVGCLTLDAVSEERARWYEGLQFQRFGLTPDRKVQMFIPLGTIKDALAA